MEISIHECSGEGKQGKLLLKNVALGVRSEGRACHEREIQPRKWSNIGRIKMNVKSTREFPGENRDMRHTGRGWKRSPHAGWSPPVG